MRVAKWGNSLAVRLPDAVVRALRLKAGDEIIIRNMAAMTQKIATSDIAKHEKDEHVSSMTPGLLNNVTPQGLADLIAYFQSLK